jgi:diphthamide biosynthesis protein 7
LAWHPWRHDSVAITTSDGEAYLVKLDPSTYSIKSNRKLAVQNTLQCWCIAFSPDSGVTATEDQEDQGHDRAFTVYTGGDDSVLRYSSYTMGKIFNQDEERADSEEGLVGEIKKIHNAGVTAILPLPIVLLSGGRVVVTGSYDDTIRALTIHDPRPELGIRPAKLLAEANLGGGVWRLKIISIKSSATAEDECSWQVRLLASCMHAGSRIVNLHIPASGDGAGVNVTGRFEEHKSMNYCSDFTRTLGGGTALAISTSFYDRLLCTWEWDMEQ